jgi:protein-export membrane protein SecD
MTAAVLVLAFKTFNLGGFERGAEGSPLGIELGLDLRGGSELRYQSVLTDPDTGANIDPTSDQMKALKRSIERRVSASGFGEPIIQILGTDRLLVQLPGISDLTRAKELIGETAQLVYLHRTLNVAQAIPGLSEEDILGVTIVNLDLSGALYVPTSTATTTAADAGFQSTTTQSETGLQSTTTAAITPPVLVPAIRIDFTDAGAAAFDEFVNRLRLSLAEIPGTEQLDLESGGVPAPGTGDRYPNLLTMNFIGGTSTEIRIPYSPLASIGPGQTVFFPGNPNIARVDDTNSFTVSLIGRAADVEEAVAIYGEEPVVRLGEVLGKADEDVGLTGDDMARAYAGRHSGSGLPIVNIEFNSEGTRKFGELTTRVSGTSNLIAIFLDDRELFASSVRRPITGGAAFIESRNFTFDRVSDLAMLLESGTLPVPIELIQERTVGASLGDESLAKSLVAGLVGLGLVLGFMVMYYRMAGVVAAVALLVYGILFLAIIKVLAVSMTLSGVAAAVLSIGMAVDANILIFERMKEELRTGRTLLSAVNIGFNRAWPAIRDGNISTLITCGILFWFADTLGASIVQVFAVTLAIGVGVSMFSAIMVSRTLLKALTVTRLNRRLSWFIPSGGSELPQQQRTAVAG